MLVNTNIKIALLVSPIRYLHLSLANASIEPLRMLSKAYSPKSKGRKKTKKEIYHAEVHKQKKL